MKNTLEKIRAEFVRRKETVEQIAETRDNELAQALFQGKAMAYKDAISFLDTMQEEADLEEAAICVWEAWNGGSMNDVRRCMDALGEIVEPLRIARYEHH